MKLTLKILKVFLIVVLSVILVAGLAFLGYYIYLDSHYYRIKDKKELEIKAINSSSVELDTTYTIATMNVGFGAYEANYSFFMDTGEMKTGKKTVGKYSRALSKENCIRNVTGSFEAVKGINPDFVFFQEVDTSSTRSYYVNQKEIATGLFSDYSNTFACNFHSSYLLYPIPNFHGSVQSGILTLSKFNIETSIRRSLPLSVGAISKFTDLDRCLSISRMTLSNGKELVLINAHLSAYDKGGKSRKMQVELLCDILSQEKEIGNYVILGGDFNQDIVQEGELFPTEQKTPDWLFDFPKDELPEGFSIASSKNAPTCRNADIFYQKDVSFTCVIDGFIVSDNITVELIETMDLQFQYSDHNPVKMQFKLKG